MRDILKTVAIQFLGFVSGVVSVLFAETVTYQYISVLDERRNVVIWLLALQSYTPILIVTLLNMALQGRAPAFSKGVNIAIVISAVVATLLVILSSVLPLPAE